MSKRVRERKSENANQVCLENHKIRVACLENCVYGNPHMTRTTHASLKLGSTYVWHIHELLKPAILGLLDIEFCDLLTH